MEYYTEVKLMGDAYGAGFSNGLTMCGSQSAAAFRKVEDMGPMLCTTMTGSIALCFIKKRRDRLWK